MIFGAFSFMNLYKMKTVYLGQRNNLRDFIFKHII